MSSTSDTAFLERRALSSTPVKIAIGTVPKDGGTFTFYKTLRDVLQGQGYEISCVSVGTKEARLAEQAYVDAGCVLLGRDENDVEKQARMFSDWCNVQGIDIVIALNSAAILSALPHLDQRVRVVSRCANAFAEGYRVTLAGRGRICRIIALTPRLRDDLVDEYGVDPDSIELIPNAANPASFGGADMESLQRWRAHDGQKDKIRLGFLGRLDHRQKGVLHLPKIVQFLEAARVPYEFRIAGKGRHRRLLAKQLPAGANVKFMGSLDRERVSEFLKETDVLVFTSHFEGCPNVLLEGMMAGCVPVVFDIDGITDFILEHGRSGWRVPRFDAAMFADYICMLAESGPLLSTMSYEAARQARRRFAPNEFAESYKSLFEQVMEMPVKHIVPRDWEQFEPNETSRSGWSAILPNPLKHYLKRLVGSRLHQ